MLLCTLRVARPKSVNLRESDSEFSKRLAEILSPVKVGFCNFSYCMHSEPLDRGLSLNSSLNFNLVYCSEIKMNSCRVYLETRPAILFLLPVSIIS